MAIKLAVLQEQEQVIAEIKELIDDGKPIGYLFANAHRVLTEKQFLAESDDDRKIQIVRNVDDKITIKHAVTGIVKSNIYFTINKVVN